MIEHEIARICHEVNRGYCQSIGDTSQPSWEGAPQWQKDSAISGVEFHLSGETTPAQSHESWLKEKLDTGWKYGPVKDPEKKEHPCMVPYEQLPAEQRAKDYLFKSVVDGFKPIVEEWNKSQDNSPPLFEPKREANLTIENNFRYHSPKEGQPAKYEALRFKAKELAYLIDDLVPGSREKSLAWTNLEQACFWANAGIARNE